jgi:hypothetical protein
MLQINIKVKHLYYTPLSDHLHGHFIISTLYHSCVLTLFSVFILLDNYSAWQMVIDYNFITTIASSYRPSCAEHSEGTVYKYGALTDCATGAILQIDIKVKHLYYTPLSDHLHGQTGKRNRNTLYSPTLCYIRGVVFKLSWNRANVCRSKCIISKSKMYFKQLLLIFCHHRKILFRLY